MSEVAPAAPAAPAPAAETVVDPNATAAPDVKTPEENKPERTFSQKELDEILEKRLAKERRKREELSRRLQVTEELALRGRDRQEPQPPKPQSDGAPKREDFPDYEAYIEAKAEWKADKKVEERFAKKAEEDSQTRTKAEREKLMQDFRGHAAKVAKEIEDFEDVMSTSEAKVTEPMTEAMLHAGEIGARIAYHLAKNPEEAERIAALPASRQAVEIGKLEMKLSSPEAQPKKPSKAPEPITPLGGKTVKGDDEPDSKDTKAWIAWRNRQIQKKRTGT
jgi:hypothetical protein